MTFRRYKLTYVECIILSISFIVLFIVCLVASIINNLVEGTIISILSILGMSAILLIVAHFYNHHYITINENGISCSRKNKLQWSLKWDEIAQIKRTRVNRNRGFALYIYNKRGESEYSFENGGYEIELSKQAKQALNFYGKSIEK